jgi:hypothetical protein
MNISDKVFYIMMGDYHYDMCQYYWHLYDTIGHDSSNQYCVDEGTYHNKKYVNYDEIYYD